MKHENLSNHLVDIAYVIAGFVIAYFSLRLFIG